MGEESIVSPKGTYQFEEERPTTEEQPNHKGEFADISIGQILDYGHFQNTQARSNQVKSAEAF